MSSNSLAKDAIAVFGQMVQSLAHIAPAVAVVFACSLILGGAGTSAPLAVLFSCLGVLPSVYLHSKLQARWSGAGGYFAILPPAFGRISGTAAGLLDLLYEPIITVITVIGFIGYGVEGWLGHPLSLGESIFISQALTFVTFILSGRKVTLISRILFLFGLCEIVLFILLSIFLLSKSSFSAENIALLFAPAHFSWSTFGKAALFGTLMFVGFESGMPFSEETKDSSRSYTWGIWISTGLAALVFLMSFFALVAANNPGGPLAGLSIQELVTLGSPYMDYVAPTLLGERTGKSLLLIILISSTISCCLASFGAGARNLFAFGRLGVLPHALATTDPSSGTPRGGNLVSYIMNAIFGLGLTLIGKPTLAFEFSATFCGTIAVILYCLVALAGIVNFRILGTTPPHRLAIFCIALVDFLIFAYIVYATISDYWVKEGILGWIPWMICSSIVITFVWSWALNRFRPHIIDQLLKRV